MNPIHLSSILKQLGEIARRQDFFNKKKKINQDFLSKKLEKDALLNKDVSTVNQKEKDMLLPKGEDVPNVIFDDESPDEDDDKKVDNQHENQRIKEDYKANFLDLTE